MSPHRRRSLVAGLALLLAPVATAGAQEILLQIRPRRGDTLHVRMDQQVEMSGTTRVGAVDSTMTMRTGMHVASRTIVLRRDARAVTVLSVTDSVALTSSVATPEMLDATRRKLEGRKTYLRISLDGSSELLDDAPDAGEMRELVAQMPATLPAKPVRIGATWTREVVLPSATQPGAKHGASVKAVFRLDSLSQRGEVAWISLRGEISRDTAPDMPPGARFAMRGTLTGVISVDRRRGWVSSARTVLSVRSALEPPAGTTGGPMQFRMTVTQWMRTER